MWAQRADISYLMILLPKLFMHSGYRSLGRSDYLVEISENGVDVEDLDRALTKSFGGKYSDVSLSCSPLSSVNGLERKSAGRVRLSWGVFDFEVVVL